MPLLHKTPFVRQKPPADLQPDEEVFLCKVTHEIFRTYDEFFERTILCNSLVWSCAITGLRGLTYQEALESEKRALQSLENFPDALVVPLLHLVTLTHRARLHEVCDDIYCYVKERFFVGETVELVGPTGVRQPCQVLDIQSPHSNGTVNNHIRHISEEDAIIISDSDNEGSSVQNSPKMPINGTKSGTSHPSLFKYKVRLIQLEVCEPTFVKASQISRKKNIFSRDRLKLLLKHHCEQKNGAVGLKAASVARYKLLEQDFCRFFPEMPVFVTAPSKCRGRHHVGSPGQVSFPLQEGSLIRAAEEKLRLMQQKEEMMAFAVEKNKLKKGRESVLEAKKKEREDKERKKEEMKKMLQVEKQKRKEEKERIKVEKEKEREKLREEKKLYAERLKQWNKRREDMECDDLKELPPPTPVKTRLPPELFGNALMVLEFLQAFGEIFDLKDEFPEGITLEVLEEALVDSDPEGPLCELLFFFLSAIFQALAEEEEEVAREQLAEADTKDLSEALEEDADRTQSALSAVSSLAAAWPQLYQGCSLKQLDLDSCTLTEILRLHILASGADCNSNNAKFRYQKQGGFSTMDDPCVELRLTNPSLLKKLSCSAVYDLLPGEKLKVLHALCGKLLTLVSTRDFIEDSAEELRQAKQELREIKAEQHRREREEAADRVRKRKEEKLKEQEMRMKEKHEKLKAEERNGSCVAEEGPEEMDTSTESQIGGKDHCVEDEDEQIPNGKAKKGKNSIAEPKETLSMEEQQQRERELQHRIQKAAACTYILPLGRDRLYRRYWIFPSIPALFVEEDFSGLTEDMLQPRLPSTASPEYESVHTPGPLVSRPNQWAFYSSPHELEQLLEALNPRGLREGLLKESLMQEKDRICQLLGNFPTQRFHHPDKLTDEVRMTAAKMKNMPASPDNTASAENFMESRLRDLLLDMEDRIYQGTLGSIKVMDRSTWRTALESGNYELLSSELRENGDVVAMETEENSMPVKGKDRLQGFRGEVPSATSTSTNTPQPVNNCVHLLAQSLGHIEQGIERKFLKAPLGEEDTKKDQKTKKRDKKKEEDQSSEKDDCSDSGRVTKTVLDRWRDSLLSCSSLSQVFLHLSTLERSVLWAKSILNARCKVCRKKGDAENMMLCDACERGHHIHCVRPKLKAVPSEDWLCPDCRPKQRSHRLTSRQRSSVDSEEDLESEDDEEEEDETEDEEEDEGEESEEERKESVSKKGQATVKFPINTKGGRTANKLPPQLTHSSPATSASKSASKSSSKKPPASNIRPPPRPGSRSSARLSQEIPSNGPQQDKRPAAEISPKTKTLLATTTTSNRRSSGRHHGVHELSACEQLTVELVRHEDSWPFLKLVSRTQVPDYYDIIKKPIALSTIREKVNNCEYKTAAEYVEDVELMFTNCLVYNPRNTNEAKAGVRLQAFFHAEAQRLGLSTYSSEESAPAPKRPRM